MVPHIGSLIKHRLEELGMKKSEFARRINTTPQNAYGIFKRKSIDTVLLRQISDVLDFDFFQYYSKDNIVILNEDSDQYGTIQGTPQVQVKTAHDLKLELEDTQLILEALKKEITYLKEINNLLKDKLSKL